MSDTVPRTVEEREERITEIDARLAEIDEEHANSLMDDDARDEWNRLNTERDEQQSTVAELKRRRERMRDLVGNPTATERADTAPAVIRKRGDDIYDVTRIRSEAHSDDDLRERLRDNAKRAVERAAFPTIERRGAERQRVRATREDAQTQVGHLLEFVDDERGTLARRILATGSPVYERAFGKAAAQLSTMGLSGEEQRALSLGVGAEGGFAVPFQLDPTVILTSNGSINPLRQIARQEQITGKEWQGITSAGITVTRVAEATEAGDNAPTLAQPTVKAERVQGFVPFSIEVDQDWPGLRSEMTRLLADAKDQEEATSFTTGNGVSPAANGVIGTLNASSNVLANAFAVGSLYALEEALPPRFRAQASIVGNKAIFNLVRQFDTAGGAALWVRLADGLPPELIGYSAYENSAMASSVAVAARYLLMGDFSHFLIVDRVGMSIELVPHLFHTANNRPTGQRGLYAIWRNNSKILTDNAFRVLHRAA